MIRFEIAVLEGRKDSCEVEKVTRLNIVVNSKIIGRFGKLHTLVLSVVLKFTRFECSFKIQSSEYIIK
jgi:hypothetical protein